VLSCAHEQKAYWPGCIMHRVGSVDRCGYGGQQKGTTCHACGACPSIWSTLKPVFHWIRMIRCAYESLICLNLEKWRFLDNNNATTDSFTLALAHARGVIIASSPGRSHISFFLLVALKTWEWLVDEATKCPYTCCSLAVTSRAIKYVLSRAYQAT
jgi:hypothetical protein